MSMHKGHAEKATKAHQDSYITFAPKSERQIRSKCSWAATN